MLFFRVENEDGLGPYQSSLLKHETIINKDSARKRHHDSNHPGPYSDIELEPHWIAMNDAIFGFIDLNQLFKWFSEEEDFSYFRKYKYRISCYESNKVYSSSYQAITEKRYLKKLIDFVYF